MMLPAIVADRMKYLAGEHILNDTGKGRIIFSRRLLLEYGRMHKKTAVALTIPGLAFAICFLSTGTAPAKVPQDGTAKTLRRGILLQS
jgi:hypothetical protein